MTMLERLRDAPTDSVISATLLRCLQVAVGLVWVLPVTAVVGASIVTGFGYEPFWDGGLAYFSGTATTVMILVAVAVATYSNSAGRSLERNWTARPIRLPKP